MRTIVFDFGNVIGFFDYRPAAQRLAAMVGWEPDAILESVFDARLGDDYESGRITTEEFLKRLQQVLRHRCSNEQLAEVFSDIFWPNQVVCELIPRLKPTYRLLLGSNTCDLHARQFRRQFDATLAHFDHLVLSHEIGARKPRAEFFEHCQRLAGCAADECLFIDDLPANVAGARARGWHGLVYRTSDDLLEQFHRLGVRIG